MKSEVREHWDCVLDRLSRAVLPDELSAWVDFAKEHQEKLRRQLVEREKKRVAVDTTDALHKEAKEALGRALFAVLDAIDDAGLVPGRSTYETAFRARPNWFLLFPSDLRLRWLRGVRLRLFLCRAPASARQLAVTAARASAVEAELDRAMTYGACDNDEAAHALAKVCGEWSYAIGCLLDEAEKSWERGGPTWLALFRRTSQRARA